MAEDTSRDARRLGVERMRERHRQRDQRDERLRRGLIGIEEQGLIEPRRALELLDERRTGHLERRVQCVMPRRGREGSHELFVRAQLVGVRANHRPRVEERVRSAAEIHADVGVNAMRHPKMDGAIARQRDGERLR